MGEGTACYNGWTRFPYITYGEIPLLLAFLLGRLEQLPVSAVIRAYAVGLQHGHDEVGCPADDKHNKYHTTQAHHANVFAEKESTASGVVLLLVLLLLLVMTMIIYGTETH